MSKSAQPDAYEQYKCWKSLPRVYSEPTHEEWAALVERLRAHEANFRKAMQPPPDAELDELIELAKEGAEIHASVPDSPEHRLCVGVIGAIAALRRKLAELKEPPPNAELDEIERDVRSWTIDDGWHTEYQPPMELRKKRDRAAAAIAALRRQVKQADERGDDAMERCHKAEERAEELERELAAALQAIGLMTTIKPTMEVRVDDPIGMAKEVSDYVRQEIEALRRQVADLRMEAYEAEGYPGIAHDFEKMRERAEKAEQELERERMRLAACGVIAMANTTETAATAREIAPEYKSASADGVAAAVDREMKLRDELAAARQQIEAMISLLSEVSANRWECATEFGDCPDCGGENDQHEDRCLLGRVDAAIDAARKK